MQKRFRVMDGIPSEVIRLGWVSFFADVSSEMLYPILPLFLTTILGAPVAAIGLIEGLAEATSSLLKTLAGWLSDKSGRRRPFIFAGYLLSAGAKPLIALATGWPLVLVARMGDRFGKGMRSSPRDALIGDLVAPQQRGRAFGWHRAMDTMGAVIGPLLALAIIPFFPNLRDLFLLAFIPGLIGALLVLSVREVEHPGTPQPLKLSEFPRPFLYYLLAWGIFMLANSSDVFLILRAQNLGYSTTQVILLYALYNLIYAVASPYLGRLSDRFERKQFLIGGLGIFALVYLGFALANAPWQIAILFTCYGLYTAATDGIGKALAVDLVPPKVRGSALGLLGTVSGLAALWASTTAGVLWNQVGPWAAFGYGAAGALLSAILLTRLGRPDHHTA